MGCNSSSTAKDPNAAPVEGDAAPAEGAPAEAAPAEGAPAEAAPVEAAAAEWDSRGIATFKRKEWSEVSRPQCKCLSLLISFDSKQLLD